jgi:hypothetical protein
MRGVVRDMTRIDQRDQDIYVEQECHGTSSRSAFTTASVTGGMPFF